MLRRLTRLIATTFGEQARFVHVRPAHRSRGRHDPGRVLTFCIDMLRKPGKIALSLRGVARRIVLAVRPAAKLADGAGFTSTYPAHTMIERLSCVLAIASCALLAACADAPAPAAEAKAADTKVAEVKMECHRETKPGTNLYQTHCGPVEETGDHQALGDQVHSMTGAGFTSATGQANR